MPIVCGWGRVYPTRDFTYITDTVAAFCAAGRAEELAGRTVHFGTGRETSIKQIAEIIMRLAGRDLPLEQDTVRVRPSTSEVERLVCDPSVFRSLTGWEAQVPLETGLQKVFDYHKQRPQHAGRGNSLCDAVTPSHRKAACREAVLRPIMGCGICYLHPRHVLYKRRNHALPGDRRGGIHRIEHRDNPFGTADKPSVFLIISLQVNRRILLRSCLISS